MFKRIAITTILFSLIAIYSASVAFAELAVRPLLPKGNLSSPGISWAPYEMESGKKRVYLDIASHTGSSESKLYSDTYEGDVEYDYTGKNIGVALDLKLDAGYLSFGFEQDNEKNESTNWGNRDEVDGYKRTYDYDTKKIGFNFTYDINEAATVGFFIANSNITIKRTATVTNGYYFSSNGTPELSGEASISLMEYGLYYRHAITSEIAVGALLLPSVNKKTDYNGDYSNIETAAGYGTTVKLAIGYQTDEFATEFEILNEEEQVDTLDGKRTGFGISAEYLATKSFSISAGIKKDEIAEFEDNGWTSPACDIQTTRMGVNYKTGQITMSTDLTSYESKDDDGSGKYQDFSISLLYDF